MTLIHRLTFILATLLAFLPLKALAQAVTTAPDGAWVTVSGTVVGTTNQTFRLDYGDGVMTVEMDDFDSFAEARQLMENDRVTVTGRVDDDAYEARTIEASSVYVQNLGTYFYASAIDDEEMYPVSVPMTIVLGQMSVIGEITDVTGREFTMDTGVRTIQVDTARLGYDPLDEVGFLRLEEGDTVKVIGTIDDAWWDEAELSADQLVEIDD